MGSSCHFIIMMYINSLLDFFLMGFFIRFWLFMTIEMRIYSLSNFTNIRLFGYKKKIYISLLVVLALFYFKILFNF